MRSDLTRRLPRRFDAPALGASHSARPLHILWIDDDPAGAGSADGLSTHGVTVDLASTGQAGIRLACGAGHDVILLSLELPDQPGTGVLAELRRLGVLSPVIALASRPDVRTAFSAGRFGAAEYRSKPLSAEELFVAIREVAVRSLPASSEGPDLSRTLPVASASAVGVTRALDALDCGLPSFGPTSESAASRLNALGRALARMASDPTLPIGFFQASCRAIRLVASEKSWAVEATVSQVRRWLSAASERESVGRHPSVRS
jgi:CheY-like chemotaxis protein